MPTLELFDAARRSGPYATRSKPAMVAISHAIERVVSRSRLPARLYSGFQRLSLFVPELPRYQAMAQHAERVVVWGIDDAQIPDTRGITIVPLAPDDELTRAWFTVAVHPSYTSALIAEDVSGLPPSELSRDFEGLWTFDVPTVAEIERYLCRRVALPVPSLEPTHEDMLAQLRHAEGAAAQLASYLERALERGRAASAARDRMVGMIVHDLNNPLTYVSGVAELLLAGRVGELTPPQRRYVQGMVERSRQMAALIGDILDAQRVEEGKLVPEIATVRLEPVIRRAAETAGLADRTEINLKADAVRADARLLERVAVNLLVNARKYGGGGAVRVEARRDGADVAIAVIDQGAGIPGDHLEGIFQPFAQGSNASARTGAGLGLAFVRGAAEAMGGTVVADNEPGAGARFTLRLPGAA